MAVSDPNLPRIDLDAVADLAMLRLNESERQSIQEDFEFILSLADSLVKQNDNASVDSLPQETSLRADTSLPSCEPEILLKTAPERRNHFFFVPQSEENAKEPTP